MRLKTILLPLLVLFIVSSCTKETTISDTGEIVGTWAVTDIRSDFPYDWDNNGYTETDIYSTYNYCQRDIVLTFDYSGYGQARQGCDAPWETVNWQFNGNRLDIYMPSGDINLYVTQFTGNTIRGYDQVQVNGRTYNITYTLSRRY